MDERWAHRIADRLRWGGVTSALGGGSPGPAFDPTPEVADTVSRVLECADTAEFVRRAYRLILSREPSEVELANRVKRLTGMPFYTRERMLRRLLGSVEGLLVRRAEQARATEATHRLSTQLKAALAQVASGEEWTAGGLAQLLRAAERTAAQLTALDGRLAGIPRAGGVACGS